MTLKLQVNAIFAAQIFPTDRRPDQIKFEAQITRDPKGGAVEVKSFVTELEAMNWIKARIAPK